MRQPYATNGGPACREYTEWGARRPHRRPAAAIARRFRGGGRRAGFGPASGRRPSGPPRVPPRLRLVDAARSPRLGYAPVPPELAGIVAFVPPWLVLALLVGLMNGAVCFVFFGRRVSRLFWYAVIGALAGGAGQVFASGIHAPAPLLIGELNVAAASVAAWLVVIAARLGGL